MARMLNPLTDEELKKTNVVNLRKEYKKIADIYNKIVNEDLVYCPHCGQWKKVDTAFYSSDRSPDGIEHYACRECLIDLCTDRDKDGNRIDNKEKTIDTFKKLDWYFDEKVYNEQLVKISERTGEKIRGTAVQQFIVLSKST